MSQYNEVDITDGGGITIQGNLPDPLPATLDACLRGFITELNTIRVLYAKMLVNDDKVAGHERLLLTKRLDLAMNFIVLARSKIENKIKMTVHIMKYNRRLQIDIQGNSWRAQGHLGRFREMQIHDFPVWLSRLQKDRLPDLLRLLGQAMSDGKIDVREKIILSRCIDRFIFSIIIVRESILSTKVD